MCYSLIRRSDAANNAVNNDLNQNTFNNNDINMNYNVNSGSSITFTEIEELRSKVCNSFIILLLIFGIILFLLFIFVLKEVFIILIILAFVFNYKEKKIRFIMKLK